VPRRSSEDYQAEIDRLAAESEHYQSLNADLEDMFGEMRAAYEKLAVAAEQPAVQKEQRDDASEPKVVIALLMLATIVRLLLFLTIEGMWMPDTPQSKFASFFYGVALLIGLVWWVNVEWTADQIMAIPKFIVMLIGLFLASGVWDTATRFNHPLLLIAALGLVMLTLLIVCSNFCRRVMVLIFRLVGWTGQK
jgi:hypothetical protein